MTLIAPAQYLVAVVVAASLAFLALLGALAGGADIVKGMVRVTVWGAMAMVASAGIGKVFGAVV